MTRSLIIDDPDWWKKQPPFIPEFLEKVSTDISALLQSPGLVIPGRYHEDLKAEWKSLQSVVLDVQKKVKLKAAVSRLGDIGLSGTHIKIKIRTFLHSRDMMLDARNIHEHSDEKAKTVKVLISLLKKYLKTASIIIGSLASLFRGMEMLKEFVEFLVAIIEQGEELHEAMTG